MCTCSLLGFEYEEILCTLKFKFFLASNDLIAEQTFDKVRKSLSVTGPVKKVRDEKFFHLPPLPVPCFAAQFPTYIVTSHLHLHDCLSNAFLYVCSAD